jgi:hypothetical protein
MTIRSLVMVVRPNVAPDIRPVARPAIVLETEDERDIEIIGRRGQCINLTHSQRMSFSRGGGNETGRHIDIMRVKNPEDSSQYVDVEAVTRLRTLNHKGDAEKLRLAKPQARDNVEILEENVRRNREG